MIVGFKILKKGTFSDRNGIKLEIKHMYGISLKSHLCDILKPLISLKYL